MAHKGDILVHASTVTDTYIENGHYLSKERFTVWGIGIVRTLRRNGNASRYASFQGGYDWEKPQTMRQVPASGVYIVPRAKFGAMTDEEIANALGARSFKSLDEIRETIKALMPAEAA